MTTELRVRKIMTPDFVRLTRDVPIRRAVAQLVDQAASAAPVIDADDTLCGILTQKDCFGPVLEASYYQEWRGVVADFMTEGVVWVEAGQDVVGVAQTMMTSPHREFPVLENGKLVGLLSRAAVLAALSRAG
ncbi:CBS domain-containing protein [Roseisalinus antarcticus]|uniref:Inosine 5-monophosphate dehydrogenase n=1 Tax=Roseisalinus antarcticus TaxID=254357 RepID=A0A1Y5RUW6_9RHOB|nr:CBS domain-containing protein [Roseisalinus antarcticus]SLN25942.1 inosine 5-monophosphate dehydrogenase [Roseisalinus antarcticus]